MTSIDSGSGEQMLWYNPQALDRIVKNDRKHQAIAANVHGALAPGSGQ
jgi:hypothetical protein